MRSISVQVQPNRSPGIDMGLVRAAFEEVAAMRDLVDHHVFDSGEDRGPYFNYTFGTLHALRLWRTIESRIYGSGDLGPHMRRASIAMCSSEAGWDDYLLLAHFDSSVRLDAASAL